MADIRQKRGSGTYLPPPPDSSDAAPESVEVPRMEPPPASLEALVRRRSGASFASERPPPRVWIPALVVAVVAVAYYVFLRP